MINKGAGVVTTFTLTGTAVTAEIAPDWVLEMTGTGTVDIQLVPIAGASGVVTNPPYVLDITVSAGITSCYLRQRMNVNSGLWTSTATADIYIATTVVAESVSGSQSLQMFLRESNGVNLTTPVNIFNPTGGIATGGYALYRGFSATSLAPLDPAPVPASTNVNTGVDGFVDIYLSFAAGSRMRVTSIQAVPTIDANTAAQVQYDEQSANREQALMGDYFIPRLEAKPVSSLLTGWDFALNPAQFGEAQTVGAAAASEYVWDQTIASRGALSAVAVARNAATSGIEFTVSGAGHPTGDAFYILQYLSGAEAKKIVGTKLSVLVNAYQDTAVNVTMRVYLYRALDSTAIPTLPTTIGTIAATGVFTLTGAFTEIPRGNLDTATAILNRVTASTDISSDKNNYGFTGWEITDAAQISNTDKFAIVVTFAFPDATNPVIVVNSISVVPGDIPCKPAVKTYKETLENCQYYYEKSYATATAIATATAVNAIVRMQQCQTQAGVASRLYSTHMDLMFRTIKRSVPTAVVLYSLAGTINKVSADLISSTDATNPADITASSFWSSTIGAKGVYYLPITSSDLVTVGGTTAGRGAVIFHYVVDCRLGKP